MIEKEADEVEPVRSVLDYPFDNVRLAAVCHEPRSNIGGQPSRSTLEYLLPFSLLSTIVINLPHKQEARWTLPLFRRSVSRAGWAHPVGF